MSEKIQTSEYDWENNQNEVVDTNVQLWWLYTEITENEEWSDESGEIIWVDKRIDYWVDKSVQFSMAAKLLVSDAQRNEIKNWISDFFKSITYQDWNAVIVYETDSKITSAINSFLINDIREKVRKNWAAIQMEAIITSLVGRTINYPQNKYFPKKKQSDWTVVDATPNGIKNTIIDFFKSSLQI